MKNNSVTHTKYLIHIYANRTSKNYKHVKQDLKKNLRYKQRWLILLDDFVIDDDNIIFKLNLKFLLLYESITIKKMLLAFSYTIENRLINILNIIRHDTKITI